MAAMCSPLSMSMAASISGGSDPKVSAVWENVTAETKWMSSPVRSRSLIGHTIRGFAMVIVVSPSDFVGGALVASLYLHRTNTAHIETLDGARRPLLAARISHGNRPIIAVHLARPAADTLGSQNIIFFA
jgi:hypothetical protein